MSNHNCPVTGAPIAEGHPCQFRESIEKQIAGWNKMSQDRELPGLLRAQTILRQILEKTEKEKNPAPVARLKSKVLWECYESIYKEINKRCPCDSSI